jgi:acylphosphatase
MPDERVTVFVRGHVQGVGFRWWTRARALELGLVGYARNIDDGRVEVLAQGPTEAIDAMVRLLSEQPSTSRRPGRVTAAVTQFAQPIAGLVGFAER